MTPRRAFLVFVLGFALTGGLELLGVLTGAVWEPFAVFLWAVFMAGPAATVLLLPHAQEGWARRAALAVPALALVGVGRETARIALREAPPLDAQQDAHLLFHALLLGLIVASALWAWRREAALARASLVVGAPALAVALTPAGDLVMVTLLAAQAVLVIGQSGFRRTGQAWRRAMLGGAGVLAAGAAVIALRHGTLEPTPGLLLAEDAFYGLALPVLACALVVAWATLWLHPARAA